MMRLFCFSSILGSVIVATASVSAFALPALPGAFSQFYADRGIDVSGLAGLSCKLCHDGGFLPNADNLNSFALDLSKNVDVRAPFVDFGLIEGLDSDGDGSSNLCEIRSGTLPSDDNSRPIIPCFPQ